MISKIILFIIDCVTLPFDKNQLLHRGSKQIFDYHAAVENVRLQ